MTEKILNMKIKFQRENIKGMSQKSIKFNIKKQMNIKNISFTNLHKKTNINICVLVILLYCPFIKVKLSHSIKICKALKLNVSDIVI